MENELPEWVQTLLDEAKEKAWYEGFNAGQRFAANKISDFCEQFK